MVEKTHKLNNNTLVVVAPVHPKLRDPDGIPAVSCGIVRRRDVIHEILNVVRTSVPVEIDKVDR